MFYVLFISLAAALPPLGRPFMTPTEANLLRDPGFEIALLANKTCRPLRDQIICTGPSPDMKSLTLMYLMHMKNITAPAGVQI